MPLDDINKLKSYDEIIADRLSEWEQNSIAEIAREVGEIGKLNKVKASVYKPKKAAKSLFKRIVAALATVTVLNIKDAKKAVTADLDEQHKNNEYLYAYRDVPFVEISGDKALAKIASTWSKKAAQDIASLAKTKALCVVDRNGKVAAMQDEIQRIFEQASKAAADGKMDFYSAMRQSVIDLGGSGARVDYGNGVTRRLDTVVRQNLLWNIKQAHKEYNEHIGEQLDADGIEIDYHANSRPSHRYMQGRQYSKGDGKMVGGVYYPSAEKAGVYDRLYADYGCRHYETDVILGVSVPRYSAAELMKFDIQDSRMYNINGIEKDGYGWTQTMRRLETEIRKAKDEINALQAFGNSDEQIAECKKRIKALKSAHQEIADTIGVKADSKRLSVSVDKR